MDIYEAIQSRRSVRSFQDKEIPEDLIESAKIMSETIKKAPHFEEYDDFKNYIMKESGLKGENFFKLLRYLLTGAGNGPDVAEIYKYLKNYIGEIVKWVWLLKLSRDLVLY